MHFPKTAIILVAVPLFLGGCVARVHTEPLPPPVVDVSYEPMYYGGYVVYYDAGGAPFYVVRGRRVYISASHAHYHTYVRHYRTNPRRYHEWEARQYRRTPPGHYHPREHRRDRDVRRVPRRYHPPR
jgi:hypothetical protein